MSSNQHSLMSSHLMQQQQQQQQQLSAYSNYSGSNQQYQANPQINYNLPPLPPWYCWDLTDVIYLILYVNYQLFFHVN